ncbi:MAG: AMP-binding protein [Solirubrobacteraceae bacterium]|nr:AMP-binding protein [Solirubrobacteraceae bacterium]
MNPAEMGVRSVKALAGAGILQPRVDRMLRSTLALKRFGPSPAAGFSGAAANYPDRPFIIDEEGILTFAEVDRRTDAIARAFIAAGLKEGDAIGVLCRNGRAFVETMLAASKLALTVLFCNTDFAGPQLADVLAREGARGFVCDEEFDALLDESVLPGRRWIGFTDGTPHRPTLEQLAAYPARRPAAPTGRGRLVILTSGTTGTPKGASREGAPLSAIVGILDRLPFKSGQIHHVVAPLFHGWGLLNFSLGLALPVTVVLRRRFDPVETLKTIAAHRVDSAAMVPTMLQRILQLPPEELARHDTSSLKMIPLSGSAIPGDLAIRAMDQFGDVVYNFYGSTETGWASIATPADLRAAPGTAGLPPMGTDLAILDDDGTPLPQGQTGRIFVDSQLRMDGYTAKDVSKEVIDSRMSTGDVGHLDAQGRLFVDGRDDDMIVSGGENVFPREVEDLLSSRDDVVEAAALGVPDDQFGQRLVAFVVPVAGSGLDADTCREHVKEHLARYKVPREIVFLDALPRNPTGKVLKRELKELPTTGS